MRSMSCAVLLALGACTASAPDPGAIDSGFSSWIDAEPGVIADASPAGPDARTAECPPGLPESFDNSGNSAPNRNATPLDPPYEHYNVFFDLDDDPRWFFAMNLYVDRGVFGAGVVPGKYDIAGEDTDYQYCALCVSLFADKDTTEGGPSQHMFAQKGTLIVDSIDGDEVHGHLEDVLLGAIEIVYDDEGEPCGDIDDDVCVNTICLNNDCGRQVGLVGCSTSIQRLDF
jgi:hypothetical protein